MFRMSRLFLAACVMGLLALAPVARAADVLMMATTTSTQDSGLLEYLEPFFKKETGMELKWVAVGTGKALEIAKNCDASSSRPDTAQTAARSCIMTLLLWDRKPTLPRSPEKAALKLSGVS